MIRVIPKDGESTVDFMELFFNLTMDSITEFLFGKSSYCLLSGSSPEAVINTRFAEAFNRALQEILRRFFVGFFHFKSQQFKDDIKFVHNYVDRYVQEALQYREAYLLDPSQAESQFGHGRYVFMHELVKRVADPVVIRTELLNVLMAGRDTTATLLSNVWYTLARRPDVYSKLRKETVETLGGTKPTLRQLQKMKYLSYIIDESQRLDPVAPFNSRMAVVDTVLPLGGGPDGKSPLLVPKGQNVSYSLYTMHRRKDYFGDDADEFRPERWETIRPTWTFLPFNGGPRICVGQQYALNEAKYITIRLVQEFAAIEPRDDKPWTENVTLSTWNLHGTKIALTPV